MNQITREFLGKNEILSSALIGFEFEFYSRLESNMIIKQLSSLLEKKIVTGSRTGDHGGEKDTKYSKSSDYSKDGPYPKEGKYGEYSKNSKGGSVSGSSKKGKISTPGKEIEPDYNQYKLIHDFSGGKSMIELITGPTPLFESKIILAKMLNWLKENGKTTERCGLHININFNKFSTPNTKVDISILDPLKFILTFDEDYVFSKFPNRKDNVFARSVDYIFPNNLFSFNDDIKTINRSSFTVPDEKYFGFNFSKLANGYLELRYLGGKNYENKIQDILDIMDYSVLTIYDCLTSPNYTDNNLSKLKIRLADHKKFVNSISNYGLFKTFYKNIDVYIDLKQDIQLLSTYWNEYRHVLFDLVYVNGMKSGHINLDTDLHKYQVKDGVFYKPWLLKDYDLIDCRFKNSIFDNCMLIGCNIKSSQLFYCEISLDNNIEDSKIKSCYIKTIDNRFTNTYIDNMPHNIKGDISRCIIRSGALSDLSTIDGNSTIISQ